MVNKTKKQKKQTYQEGQFIGAGIALGTGVGVALGTALDNIGMGIALGVTFGIVFGTSLEAKYKKEGKVVSQPKKKKQSAKKAK